MVLKASNSGGSGGSGGGSPAFAGAGSGRDSAVIAAVRSCSHQCRFRQRITGEDGRERGQRVGRWHRSVRHRKLRGARQPAVEILLDLIRRNAGAEFAFRFEQRAARVPHRPRGGRGRRVPRGLQPVGVGNLVHRARVVRSGSGIGPQHEVGGGAEQDRRLRFSAVLDGPAGNVRANEGGEVADAHAAVALQAGFEIVAEDRAGRVRARRSGV